MNGSVVYFAVAGDLVKIGVSTYPTTRVQQLRRATSGGAVPAGLDRSSIVLAATVPGGRAAERAMHRRFAEARVVGEWFWVTPELQAFMDIATYAPPEQVPA